MRVLLADDDEVFRAGLAALLVERAPGVEVIGSVGDGNAAVTAAMGSAPSVVLIDYAMPGPSGGHAAAVIQQALPGTRVVILSGLPPEELADLPSGVEVIAKGPAMADAIVAALAQA